MSHTRSFSTLLARVSSVVALFVLTVPAAFASEQPGGEGTSIEAADNLGRFLTGISQLFTGPVGTAIGIIAFAAAGVYIMYARQTGQAVGAIAKVFVGLLILFGGTALVTTIASGASF